RRHTRFSRDWSSDVCSSDLLTEPSCVAYNAVVVNSRLKPGDRVVVIGPGTIGILCAAMARLNGAEVAVVGLEGDQKRLETAKQRSEERRVGKGWRTGAPTWH